jgi:hypothetical protein
MCQDIHPSDRVTISTCDSDEYCVTPGQRRKVNVYFDRGQPVLHVCKGCARKSNKLRRERENG